MASSSEISVVELSTEDATDKRSLFRTLIRYTMRTFYDFPLSLVAEYIYHYKCINLEDLAKLLKLNRKEVYSYTQQLKREKFIIEEHRGESKNKFDATSLYYKIDIAALFNGIKYRLIKMQLEIKEFEQVKPMLYKCEKCSKEYNEFDISKLFQNSFGEDLKCTHCSGLVSEKTQTEQESIPCDTRLFNEQTKVLFQILEKLDKIMKDQPSTMEMTSERNDVEYTINMETDSMDSSDDVQVKPLPEWFTRSIELDDSDS